jgi:hypothetical protein
VADDLLQLVRRKPGLTGGGGDRVAGRRVRLAERGDRLLDLLGTEADLGREIFHRGVVRKLTEDSVQHAHRGSPSSSAAAAGATRERPYA